MPVEQLRNLLLIGLCFTGFLLWQSWQEAYAPKPVPQPQPVATTPAAPADGTTPADGSPISTIPGPAEVPSAAGSAPAAAAGSIPATAEPVGEPGAVVKVKTDLMRVSIDPRGGAIIRADLLEYPVSTEDPTPFTLLDPNYPDRFVAYSGLKETKDSAAAPGHATLLAMPADTSFGLSDGQDVIEVPFEYTDDTGLTFRKIFTFKRDSYVIGIRYEVTNGSTAPWGGSFYAYFERPNAEQSVGLFQTYTYTGGVVSTAEGPYEKVDFGDMDDENLTADSGGGWVAMIEHYFTTAFVPRNAGTNRYYTRVQRQGLAPLYNIGVVAPVVQVAAGASATLEMDLFAGPKIAKRLEKVIPGLERTVDYGWLWLIAQPLFWLLDHIHDIVGNWGWSVILLTLLIKLAFFQLSATSYKSMARMRKLQPRMVQLRERYGDDKQKLNQSMMELYKTEKVNPLGGCLPILVQIPVFISLYWVLLESVELRQAPFMLWIKDMSIHDPYFVLPLAMGATMFFQQKLNPAPPDPMQAKIMQFLPVVFTALFLFFPSGLVLYWFVNNLLSIAQQWIITRKIIGPDPTPDKS